jgi:hypothetical protein
MGACMSKHKKVRRRVVLCASHGREDSRQKQLRIVALEIGIALVGKHTKAGQEAHRMRRNLMRKR